MGSIGEWLGDLTPRQRLWIGVASSTALLWHLMLPEFMGSAAWIEGPLPAIAGAAFGLRLTRGEDPPMRILGLCAAAVVGETAATLVLGMAFFGPVSMVAGLYGLVRSGFHLPTTSLLAAWGTPFALWGLWMSLKTLLVWGAVGFAIQLYRRHGRDWLHVLLRGIGDRRVVATDRRQRLREYYRDYAAAIRRGEEPPAPPVMLPAPGAMGGTDVAQLSFWGIRIGLTLVGAFGFYATFGDLLSGNVGEIFLRGLLGG